MRATDWLKEARRRCSADLFLCRNHVQAKAVGVHPECMQIWDRAPHTHEPYFVVAVHFSGLPRDPSDVDIDILQSMSSDREHQGRKGWIDDLDKGARDRFPQAEEEYAERVRAYFAPGGEGHAKTDWVHKKRFSVAQTIPGNQGNHRRIVRPKPRFNL